MRTLMWIKFTRRRHERLEIIQCITADAASQLLIKPCRGSICLLALCLIRRRLSPLKLAAPLSQPLLRPLWGEWWGSVADEGRGRGITRHGEARYERAYGRSYEGQFAFHGGPGIPPGIWRNLRGGQRGGGGVGGWSGGGRRRRSMMDVGGSGGAVNCWTVLKAANLVNGKEHMGGKKASGQVGGRARARARTRARTPLDQPPRTKVSHEHARTRLQKQTAYK